MRRAFATLVALAALVAACGGDDRELNLSKSIERTKATGSARIEITQRWIEEGENVVSICAGAVDYAHARYRLTCDDAELGRTETVGVPDAVYIRLSRDAVTGGGVRWQKLRADNDPLRDFSPNLLNMLRGASRETEQIGEDDVRGAPTVRYRLIVEDEEVGAGPGQAVPVEVWIDGDGAARKIVVENSGTTVTIEFFDFGVEVDIKAPPAEEVAEFGDGLTPAPFPCAEDASPIRKNQAIDALRRHGFSLNGDKQACFGNVAAVLTNGEGSDVLTREGILDCFLYTRPPDLAPKSVVRRGVDGGDAELVLANLTCTILADSPNGEEKIDPLEEAFAELQRAIRP